MSPFLLDTNILSYFIKGLNPGLYLRMSEALNSKEAVIFAVTRSEVRHGQCLMAADDKRRRRIDLLLNQLPALPWTETAADLHGPLKARRKQQGTPIGELDTKIAAHALAEGLTLVTHNTHHFERIPA